MSWTTDDIPSLHGRAAVVTGANGGLGLETARALARAGAQLWMAASGALPQLRAATDPAARGGEMYAPRFVNFGAPVRRPILRLIGLDDAIETLWEVSERETGVSLDVSA